MARKIRFALEMHNKINVRNLDELRAHFDLDKAVEYFNDGTLLRLPSLRKTSPSSSTTAPIQFIFAARSSQSH